jgi:hypothetical protein
MHCPLFLHRRNHGITKFAASDFVRKRLLDLIEMSAANLQDDILRRAVQVHKGKNWKKIGEQLTALRLGSRGSMAVSCKQHSNFIPPNRMH